MSQVVMNLGAQQNQTDTVLLDSCLVQESPESGVWILGADGTGSVTLRNTTVQNTGDFGIRIDTPPTSGVVVEVVGTQVKNVGMKGHYPILIQHGGVTFHNTTVLDVNRSLSHPRNWLEVGWRSTEPVTRVAGDVMVVTLTGILF